MTKDYLIYLKSPAWKIKKQQVFLERGRTCEICMSNRNIQIHHKTYDNLYNEDLEDLKILCDKCHKKEHKIGEKKQQPKKDEYITDSSCVNQKDFNYFDIIKNKTHENYNNKT